jgi:hypothetical protein
MHYFEQVMGKGGRRDLRTVSWQRLGILAYRRAGGGQGGSPEPGEVHGGVLLGSALDILRAGVPDGGLHGRAVFMGIDVPDD